MPPLTGTLQRNADYFQLEWMADSYPGKRDGDRVWAHPIYGAYVLKDYLDQLGRGHDDEVRDALVHMARVCLDRMETQRGARVFWYDSDGNTSRATDRYFSGLTQAYYASALARVGRMSGEQDLLEAASEVFASLRIPVADGGVLSPGRLGPSIAEVSRPDSVHVLNGWQSALAAISEYAETREDDDARHLVVTSAAELARLLPAYDAPALQNSRYGLSGYVYVRLIFREGRPRDIVVRNCAVHVPGHGATSVAQVDGGRWSHHVLSSDLWSQEDGWHPVDNVLRFNVVLSRVSYPECNRIRWEVEGPGGLVEVQVQRGRYDPLTASAIDRQWVTVSRHHCPPGVSEVDVTVPWDVADLIAYPTNFKKVLEGHQTNVYHVVHINRLRELAELTGIDTLNDWADTWQRYLGEWQHSPLYRDLYVRWGSSVKPVGDVRRVLPARPARALSGAALSGV